MGPILEEGGLMVSPLRISYPIRVVFPISADFFLRLLGGSLLSKEFLSVLDPMWRRALEFQARLSRAGGLAQRAECLPDP